MMPIKAIWFGGVVAGSAYIIEKSASTIAFPPSSFTTTSTSNVDLLNGSGGQVIRVVLTISSGSVVWIAAGAILSHSANAGASALVVNDGTTDYDVALEQNAAFSSALQPAPGNILISGLSAGTYTFKLRVRAVIAGTVTFGTNSSAYLRATEVKTSTVGVITRSNAGQLNVAGSGAYVDLVDQASGNTYPVTLTKLAGTDLLVIANASVANGVTTGINHRIGVLEGSTDLELGRNRTFSAGPPRTYIQGCNLFTGLSAGSKTLKLRYLSSGSTGNLWQTANTGRHTSHMAVIETGLGGINGNARFVAPSSDWSTASTTNVDVLDATAGSPVTVTLTKTQADSHIVVVAMLNGVGTASLTGVLAVNNGTTDYDVCRNQFIVGQNRSVVGERLLTGMPAGAHTFTLRARVSTSTLTVNTQQSVSLAAFELVTGDPSVDAADTETAFQGSTFALAAGGNTDLLDGSGGNPITVTITKGAETNVMVSVGASFGLTSSSGMTVTLGVNDGLTDYDVCDRTGSSASGVFASICGDAVISGLPAGTYTFTLRARVSGMTVNFGTDNSCFVRAWEVKAP